MKERFQNPVSGDTVRLRLLTYDSHNLSNVDHVEKVEIYFYDPQEKTEANPQGLRLVETVPGAAVQQLDTGQYAIDVVLESEKYVIGRYVDVWTLYPSADLPAVRADQQFFDIYPHLFYTSPAPIVYDFTFHFQPNRLRQGSKQYLTIEVTPNAPNASDMKRYYEMLIAGASLYISIEQAECGPCPSADADLRLVVEDVKIEFREKKFGYYQVNTEDMDCGLYNVWFRLEFGENTYISDKMQFQVY